MTGSNRTEAKVTGAVWSADDDSKRNVISRPSQPVLWDGRTAHSIKEVYTKNIVELECKHTVAAIGKAIIDIVFSCGKFLTGWNYDWIPYPDKAKDNGFINAIFERMGWEFADDETKTLQAIKMNTYRDCAKSLFIAHRASCIAQAKRILVQEELAILQAGSADDVEFIWRNKYQRHLASDKTRETRGDRQEVGLIEKLLRDEDAYAEFMKTVVTGILGMKRMNEMCERGATYESVVAKSDEAFGLLLLEDKSLLWWEVAKKGEWGLS